MTPPAKTEVGILKGEKKKLDLIHERFKYSDQQWSKIRSEAKEDMRHVSGDPWDPKEKQARKAVNRPTPANDEISQYLNQVINGVKENKRAIGFNPVGFGADEKTSEFYEGKWREIWYRSHAQQHTTRAFQNMVERSYGFCKMRTEYVTDIPARPTDSHSAFNQRLVIDGIPDPDCIYPDPDFLDATGRDWQWLFEIETQSLKDFRRNFPKAEIQSFSPELVKYARGWISNSGQTRTLRIASYWEIEKTRRILNLWELRDPKSGQTLDYELFDDDLELADMIKKAKGTLIDKREVDEPTVYQYRTNGVEILKKTKWAGRWIPYVGFFGKMFWLDLGSGPELVIQSMVRLARGPNMMLAYYLACELEIVGKTPKMVMRILKGTLDAKNAKKLSMANLVPVPYIEFNDINELTGRPNEGPAALGIQDQYEPPIQAIEVAKEAARRAIQAAMGLTPLPTSAQRRNEKSGVALKQIEESGQRGSYHFIDSYDMGLVRLGELGEDLIPKVHDAAGETPTLDAQKRPQNVFINADKLAGEDGQVPQDAGVPEGAIPSIEGLHAVTIEVEPDFASERDKAQDFVNTFVASPVFQALPPPMALEILALMVKLMNLGPIGNEIADVLHPDEQEEQMVPAAKLQEVIQAGEQMKQFLTGEIQRLEQEQAAKVIDNEAKRVIATEGNQSKERIAALNADVKIEDRDIQSDTMILLEQMRQQFERLALRVQSEDEARKVSADIQKTGAQLEQQTATGREDRTSAEREGERGRQATSRENAASRESADRNAAEERKVKVQTAAQKKPATKK